MTPRLLPVPLTAEDWEIVTRRWYSATRLRRWRNLIAADRHDADLMLTLTRASVALRNLKKKTLDMYNSLSPKERDVLKRVFGTERPEPHGED